MAVQALAGEGRYRRTAVAASAGHAVVVGAGVAGLLAARVLADAVDVVTVLDRDVLPQEPSPRRGVPQGRHPHALLESGRTVLEDLFPGFGEDLVRAGGLVLDAGREARQYEQGSPLAEGVAGRTMHFASRPLVEGLLRRRLAAHPGVQLRGGCALESLLGDAAHVEGVVVHREEAGREVLRADVVVDATGRGSRTPRWLADQGTPPPPVEEVHVDVGYATRMLLRPRHDRRAVLVAPAVPGRRGGSLVPIEDDRWLLTLGGVHGDHPPLDPDGFQAFAATLPTPVLAEVLEAHEPASAAIERYRFLADVRRRYEDLDQVPENLVVIGDALACVNPMYGQGMSLAALQAVALHRALATGGVPGLACRFFPRAAAAVDGAWSMAVGADLRYADTPGRRPRGTRLVNRYVARLGRAAQADDRLADAFRDALALTEPPSSLFRPANAWRALRPRRHRAGRRPGQPAAAVVPSSRRSSSSA